MKVNVKYQTQTSNPKEPNAALDARWGTRTETFEMDDISDAEGIALKAAQENWEEWLRAYRFISAEVIDETPFETSEIQGLTPELREKLEQYYALATVDINAGKNLRTFIEEFMAQTPERQAANLLWVKSRVLRDEMQVAVSEKGLWFNSPEYETRQAVIDSVFEQMREAERAARASEGLVTAQ